MFPRLPFSCFPAVRLTAQFILAGGLLLASLVMLMSAPLLSQAATTGLRAEPPLIDFGHVRAGTVVRRSVLIRNLRPHELVIVDAVPDCGCSVAEIGPSRIPAFGAARLGVEVHTSGLHSHVQKQVRLDTSPLLARPLIVPLTGFVDSDRW